MKYLQTYIGLLTMYSVHSWTIPYRMHYHFYPARLSFSAFWEVLQTKWWMWWFLQAQWCSSIRGCCTERDAINTAHAPGIPCALDALEMGSGCVHMVLFMFYTYFILWMVLVKVLLMVLLMFTWCVLYVCWILIFVVCPLLSLWFLLDFSRIILCLCPNMKKNTCDEVDTIIELVICPVMFSILAKSCHYQADISDMRTTKMWMLVKYGSREWGLPHTLQMNINRKNMAITW